MKKITTTVLSIFFFYVAGYCQINSAIKNQTITYQLGGFSLSGGPFKLFGLPLTTATTDKVVTVNSTGNLRSHALSLQFIMNGGTTSTLGATFNGITIDKASPALGVLIDMTGTTATTSFREYKMRADNTGAYYSGGYFGTLFNMQRVTYSYWSAMDSSTASAYATTLIRLYPYNQVVIGNSAPYYFGGKLQVMGGMSADTIKMRVKRSSTSGDSILLWNPADSSFRVSSKITVLQGGTGLTTIGSALQHLRVNAAGTALEYATSSAGTLQATTGAGNTSANTIALTGANKFSDSTGLHLWNGNVYFGNPIAETFSSGVISASSLNTNTTGNYTVDATGGITIRANGSGQNMLLRANSQVSINSVTGIPIELNGRISINTTFPGSTTDSLLVVNSSSREVKTLAANQLSSMHQSPGTVTFTPVSSPDTYFGTGYSINISGDGDHFKLTINTGTGISASGTLGHFTLPAGFASTPVAVWSGGTVTTNATNIGFGINGTSATDLIMFNSSQFLPSATYIYNIICGL